MAEDLKGRWAARVHDEANRRGLEPEYLAVMLTELVDVPPPGVAGPAQVGGGRAGRSGAWGGSRARPETAPLRSLDCGSQDGWGGRWSRVVLCPAV